MTRRNKHIGSSVESFLAEEGILDSATEKAVKAVVAWQLTQEMKRQSFTKTAMAKMLETSRAQLNRILDPEHESVTVATLHTMAKLLGRKLVIELR